MEQHYLRLASEVSESGWYAYYSMGNTPAIPSDLQCTPAARVTCQMSGSSLFSLWLFWDSCKSKAAENLDVFKVVFDGT